ncbi:MAG: universal stress protein [Sedimentisphaerales bacterium]|nr:universal stress protein [Sedimentisphaerales bacterium]
MTEERSVTYYRRILFCTDFSENADFAFSFALDAACRRPGTVLYLLHVIPETEAQFWKTYIYEVDNVDDKARHDIDEKIQDAYLSHIPAEAAHEVVFRVGRADQVILEFAEENDVDLIVIGRQGHGGSIHQTFFGNVAEKIARKAPCAVLIVPLSFKTRFEETP